MQQTNTLEKFATVVLLLKDGQFYLAKKKQDIHANGKTLAKSQKWNGYGGKQEEGDVSLRACAIRELAGESGVVANEADLIQVAHIQFFWESNTNISNFDMDVTFYLLEKYEGEPKETAEMGKPKLFSIADAPYEEMMPADKFILHTIMSRKEMDGKVFYAKDNRGKRYVKTWTISINSRE